MLKTSKRRIGIVGFGNLGKYLVSVIEEMPNLELAFVWNRNTNAMDGKVDSEQILVELSQFAERKADLIVEVAHPTISMEYGEQFLEHADYMIGSPTALADQSTEDKLRRASSHSHGLYVPCGALWGGEDIRRMADRGTLQNLKITMTKDPKSFFLLGELKEKNAKVTERTVLYDADVRRLCHLAPNNVNTMAAAAVAAHNLGFGKIQGSIVADPSLGDWHIVDIEVWGPGDRAVGTGFYVHTVRRNPAPIGHVTGKATYGSFVSSMLAAGGKGAGVHLC